MSSSVNVTMSAVIASAARRSARQCRKAPSRPSEANTTVSPRCRPPIQSRPHCQLKYWTHIAICAVIVACRWLTGGLPYCCRVSTSQKACKVVGSPSLIGGEGAARIGREKENEMPGAAAARAAGGGPPNRRTTHTPGAPESGDGVYPFSFTPDGSHRVNGGAEKTAPASAASRRGHMAGTHARSKRSPTRNQHPAATALVTAASKLIRIAYPAASGSKPQTCARIVNSGLPGGCGMPSTYAAAMYSEASQNCVVGASVTT